MESKNLKVKFPASPAGRQDTKKIQSSKPQKAKKDEKTVEKKSKEKIIKKSPAKATKEIISPVAEVQAPIIEKKPAQKEEVLSIPTPEEMLEVGLHFGHSVRRGHPSMQKYVFTTQKNIHIIDLFKTQEKLKEAAEFLRHVAREGGQIVFIATKKQAQETLVSESKRCGALFVSERWLGGTLTNFEQIKRNINKLKDLKKKKEKGELSHYTKKEQLLIDREIRKLERTVGGIAELKGVPGAIFVLDAKMERTACREAVRLGVPIVGLCDTNNDISKISYPIPGNDDALRSISLVLKVLADAVEVGYKENKESKSK